MRRTLPGLFFVFAAAAMLAQGCSREPEKADPIRPLRVIKVGDVSGIDSRSFPGRAKAFQEVDLSFRVPGTLAELPNDIIGREFGQGELIARLDPRDYEVRVRDVEGQLEPPPRRVGPKHLEDATDRVDEAKRVEV